MTIYTCPGCGATLVDLRELDLLVGSGGVLSHAPRRAQAALMLIDAFEPEGVTHLAVDSIFMMPQLGVLASIHEAAATQVFDRDCLVRLGSCVAPTGRPRGRATECVVVSIEAGGRTIREAVPFGELRRIPLPYEGRLRATVAPARGFDMGAGPGKPVEAEVEGGVVGVVVDARGRPLAVPADRAERVRRLRAWARSLSAYPEA